MSISHEIAQRVENGEIVSLQPYPALKPQLRSMYIEAKLYDTVFRFRDDKLIARRFASLEADLQVFLTEPIIDPGYLFGLVPPGKGVWEIRSVRPSPP